MKELLHVFQPIEVGPVTVPNRIVRSAHATGLTGQGIGDELIAYHEARARGEVGLTTLEAASVHPSTNPGPIGIHAWEDAVIPGYERLMSRLEPYAMRVFQQLWHGGYEGPPFDGSPPWSASALPSVDIGVMSIAMTKAQIDEIVDAYASAARRAQQGGLHGVEIQLAHGYLPNQFLSPLANHREDEYGGSLENRMRFPLEVIRAVRDRVGSDFAVGVRLNGEDSVPGGLTNDDMVRIAARLEATGSLDFVNVSLGSRFANEVTIAPMSQPHGHQLPTSVPVTAALSLPTMVTGRILTLAEAERIIAAGEAEMASMVRATIADPDLVRKTREGRVKEVRPCIGCNHGCIGGLLSPVPRLGCALNVGAGQELTLGDDRVDPAESVRKVLVIGGGPAGLEAARVAALRGHSVVLYEAREQLGGQISIARRAPLRGEIGGGVDWMARELGRLGVELKLGVRVDADIVAAEAPDAVVLATGGVPRTDGFQAAWPAEPVTGLAEFPAYSSWQVLEGEEELGDSVLVVDDIGHYEGIAVVDALFERVETVHYVTRFNSLCPLMEPSLSSTPARGRFAHHDFRFHATSVLVSVDDGGATIAPIEALDITTRVAASSTVIVSGPVPDTTLERALREQGVPLTVVGDALGPRYLQAAVRDGHLAGLAAA